MIDIWILINIVYSYGLLSQLSIRGKRMKFWATATALGTVVNLISCLFIPSNVLLVIPGILLLKFYYEYR